MKTVVFTQLQNHLCTGIARVGAFQCSCQDGSDCGILESNEAHLPVAFMGVLGSETAEELNVGKRSDSIDKDKVAALVQARLDARKQRDFKESDRIRDELAALGISLKDAKDPTTGEIVTTWDIAR